MSIKRIEFEYALSKVISGAIIEFCNEKECDQPAIDALVDEAWQRLKDSSPGSLQRERVAVVLDDAISEEHVQNYLPQGYTAKIEYLPGNQAGKTSNAMRIVIRGYDIAGWTLGDYVIPRLASGMIVATEVFDNDSD
tara:strand:+ start:736 stop:1146 length:411 start_codon:yes stop_codon:yes gene_type:complete